MINNLPTKSLIILLTLTLSAMQSYSAQDIEFVDADAVSSAKLHVVVTDDNGDKLPCCIALTNSRGESLWGLDAHGEPLHYRAEPRIWISGDAIINVTPDVYKYVISRPYRYKTVYGTCSLQAGQSKTLQAELECVIDLPKHGWYGGDAHQHIVHGEKEFAINVETAAQIAESEGGDWSSFNGYWSSVGGDNPTLDEMRDRCAALSHKRFLALLGEEYPKDHMGHMAFMAGSIQDWVDQIGKNEYSYPAGQHEKLAHFEILRNAFRMGGLAVYTHPIREWGGTKLSVGNIARELPFDLITSPELIPSIDWMTDDPTSQRIMDVWSMYLNWGYKIGICAFTDSCYDRKDARPFNKKTFVFLRDKELNSANIIQAISQGATYGTSGPLLMVDMDNQPLGSTFRPDGMDHILAIDAYAPEVDYDNRMEQPTLDRIEIIRNGDIYKTIKLREQKVRLHRTKVTINENETAWYIVKVFATGKRQVAITSPFYFRSDNYKVPIGEIAHVKGVIKDSQSGEKLDAEIDIVEYNKNHISVLETIHISDGSYDIECSATLRLRVKAPGYKQQIKSIFFDDPNLYTDLILPLKRTDMLDPEYYKRIRALLKNITLDFDLTRK